jgi:hypothetical protein
VRLNSQFEKPPPKTNKIPPIIEKAVAVEDTRYYGCCLAEVRGILYAVRVKFLNANVI